MLFGFNPVCQTKQQQKYSEETIIETLMVTVYYFFGICLCLPLLAGYGTA